MWGKGKGERVFFSFLPTKTWLLPTKIRLLHAETRLLLAFISFSDLKNRVVNFVVDDRLP